MKKLFLFAVCAGLVFASCSNDKVSDGIQNETAETQVPVGFGFYTNATRATATTLDIVKTDGIGVFAFEQATIDHETFTKTNFQPNFMFNQKVYWSDPAWVYSPVKYWPNNPGAKVSFFAYAPYTADLSDDSHIQTPETNTYLNEVSANSNGLTLVLGYDSKGPAISYQVPADATKGIDLMWGQENGYTYAPVNKTKPNIADKIQFKMKHALSAMSFTVQVVNDLVQPQADGGEIANGTTINIKRVSLIGNFANKGTLRLYDGQWQVSNSNYGTMEFKAGAGQFSTTVEGGLDGAEAKTPINLLQGTLGTDFITAIPNASFYIEIEYDVVTVDPADSKNNSKVTNIISTLPAGGGTVGSNWTDGKITLDPGKAYQFDLTLGMTTVKFNVGVEDWSALDEEEVDLPKNTPKLVTGVSLNLPTLALAVGGSETLIATVTPADATNKNVTWTSSDETVATVVNGVVTGVAAGTATITATTEDGGLTATCTVTVS